VSILPFLRDGDFFELHCLRADPTFAALQRQPHATFVVEAPGQSDGRHQVRYHCEAAWSTNPGDIAATVRRMAEAHEGRAGEDGIPAAQLSRLAKLRLRILQAQVDGRPGSPIGG
jgi:hypothetical protein